MFIDTGTDQYRCIAPCGWSGTCPSLTEDSVVEQGAATTIKRRYWRAVCPQCFSKARLVPPRLFTAEALA
jgi:hypothetical protein